MKGDFHDSATINWLYKILSVSDSLSILYAIDEHSAFNKLKEGFPSSVGFDAFEKLKQINGSFRGTETVSPKTDLKDAVEKYVDFSDRFLGTDWYNMHDVAVSLSRSYPQIRRVYHSSCSKKSKTFDFMRGSTMTGTRTPSL